MIIREITLTNFRNHTKYKLKCKKNTTLILGENGSGKTSVLEAIYILTRGKSFRASDSEIIKRNQPYYRAELIYQNGEKMIVTYDQKNKTFISTDKKTSRLPKNNRYPIILFQPSDLNLASSSPSRRRDYFNNLFSELDEKYHQTLLKYEKALKQRNEILKKEFFKKEELFSWNILLAKYGVDLFEMRNKYTKEINQSFTKTYQSIAKTNDTCELSYQTEIKNPSTNNYLSILEQNLPKDKIIGHTSFGPHRDDFIFMFNQKIADGSASRGETRSVILALKFIEAELIQKFNQQKPIILLDDVFSELDNTRRKCLVENFRDHQVIITSVEAF